MPAIEFRYRTHRAG